MWLFSRVFGLVVMFSIGHVAQAGDWVISVQTANSWMAGFVGDVTACFHFAPSDNSYNDVEDQNLNTSNSLVGSKNLTFEPVTRDFVQEDCQPLPVRHFERGKLYKFGIKYAEDLPLDKVRLISKTTDKHKCKKSGGDTWHIEDITFHSLKTGQLFRRGSTSDKTLKMIFLESGCRNRTTEITLDSFDVSVEPRPCNYDFVYDHGESFEDGCSASCQCHDGGIACVSRCPPYIAPECRDVYEPGQCCTTALCEKDLQIRCPVYEDHDCDVANRTVDPTEYPWSAFIKICNQTDCTRFCSGTLLSEKWVLTAAECVIGPNDKQLAHSQLRVIVGEYTLILAEDQEVELEVVDIQLAFNTDNHLALVKLKEAVVFDRAVQPATLPLHEEMCLELVKPGCALALSGWINVGSPKAEQYDLYKLSTKIENSKQCQPSIASVNGSHHRRRKPQPPTKPGDNGICLNLANDQPFLEVECGACGDGDSTSNDACAMDKNAYLCTGERGRPLISKVLLPRSSDNLEVNYLVGLISYSTPRNETLANVCLKAAYQFAVNICNDLNWIKTIIFS